MSRRRMLLLDSIDPEEKYLKHWWSGEDELIKGVLKDRMGTGFDWEIQGNPVHENKTWIFQDTNTYGTLFAKNTSDWDLGHHFKLSVDIDVMKGGWQYWSTFLDMSSVTDARKNIGFSATSYGLVINWKLQGNNSNPGFSKDSNYPDDMKFNPDKWNTVNGYYLITDKKNGYDRCIVKANNKQYEFPLNIPKVEYKNMNNVFRSTLGRGATNGYGTYLRLRDIKIYVYD